MVDLTFKKLVADSLREAFYEAEEEGDWVTINGRHILIKPGETAGQAYSRMTGGDHDALKQLVPKDQSEPKMARQHDFKVTASNDNDKATIRDVVAIVPEAHLHGLSSVEVVDTIEGKTELGTTIGGQYVRQGGVVSIIVSSETMKSSDFAIKGIVLHEVGHNVWYNNLTPRERASWSSTWSDNQNEFVGDYGRISPGEGFAEAYQEYEQHQSSFRGNNVMNWFEANIWRARK